MIRLLKIRGIWNNLCAVDWEEVEQNDSICFKGDIKWFKIICFFSRSVVEL